MTIQDLGSIGELIAAIATIATLVYLAIQIRYSTKTTRGNTHNYTATAWSELSLKIATDADLSALYALGRRSPEKLSKEEITRFYLVVDATMSQIENIWVQYKNGLFYKSDQDRFDNILRSLFSTPGIQQYWSKRRDSFTVEFIEYVENELGLVHKT